MGQIERTKMCQFCEGSIPIEAGDCPYCGQSPIENHEGYVAQKGQTEPNLEDRYQPPYVPDKDIKLKASSPQTNVNDPFAAHKEEFARNEQAEKKPERLEKPATKKETLSILLLSIGAQLFAVGLLIVLFSTDGKLTLEWASRYWYVYCLLGLPMIFFGRYYTTPVKES